MVTILCLLFSLFCPPFIFTPAFPRQQLFGIQPFGPGSEEQTGLLRRFRVRDSQQLEGLLEGAQNHNLDIWQVAPTHIDIYSPPSSPPLPLGFRDHGYTISNIPVHQNPTLISRTDWNLTSLQDSPYHSIYHPLFEIDKFMYDIAALHPDIVKVVQLGHSGEGREMLGLRISRETEGTKCGRKFGFVITGAQHAREWIATATSLYLTHALVSNASEPRSLTHLLGSYDFYVIPSPNPDGYVYTWEQDRFWYKNRMILGPKARCIGLDMNRNWGYKWKHTAPELSLNVTGKRRKEPTDPCSHWYPGRRPFQAPEVNNIANYVATLGDLIAFVELRSYGQMLSYPFSYSCKRYPKAAEDQTEAAMGATFALRQVHGTSFSMGTLCSMLYRAPGNVVDWMYARAGIKYSYAAHLRDTGTYGFSLPAEWIRPVGEETGNMIDYLAKFILRNPND